MSLTTGISQLIYFTFLHNADAIAYVIGIFVCFFILMVHPKRTVSLFLLGFILLELRFQYLKHIVDPLYDQTVGTLFENGTFFKARRLVDLFINDLIPILLYLGGWGSVFTGIFFSVFKRQQEKESGHTDFGS